MLFVLPSTWHRMHPSPISPWLGSHFPLAAVAAVARCWWSILDIFRRDWPWWLQPVTPGDSWCFSNAKNLRNKPNISKYILTPNYKYWEHFVLLSWPISGSLKWPTLDRPLYCDIRGNHTGIWTFDFGMFNEYMAGIQWSTIDLYWDWHGAGIESIEAFVIPANTSTLPIDIPRAHDLHGPHYLRTVRTSVSMMSCPLTTHGFYMVSWCLNVENPTLHTSTNCLSVPPTIPTSRANSVKWQWPTWHQHPSQHLHHRLRPSRLRRVRPETQKKGGRIRRSLWPHSSRLMLGLIYPLAN